MLPYPQNYTDPHGDDPVRAQCTKCCEWKDASDMVNVERVPDLEYGAIPQGICRECDEKAG